jgi:predicted site-specific integrase-resolvase
MIETIATIDIIESALADLNKLNYNNKEETEKKVVNAKITLQTYRDKLQNEVNEFDKWAKNQSDIDTSIQLEIDSEAEK